MISRALVAILLMMNLGVAAWWMWGPGPYQPVVRDATIAGIPQLQLLSERGPVLAEMPARVESSSAMQQAAAEAVAGTVDAEISSESTSEPVSASDASVATAISGTPGAVPDSAAAQPEPPTEAVGDAETLAPQVAHHCFSIGPFAAIDDVRRTSALIESSLQRQQVREVRSNEIRGYRVYLPPFPTRQEAMDAARTLQEKGLRDYYVVTAGEQENTVSLGLFRDLANAQSRRELVRGFGFEPRLEPRQQELTRWWLDIAVATDDDGWRTQATRYEGTRIEALPCQ
jgi:cell division septation protein DedD